MVAKESKTIFVAVVVGKDTDGMFGNLDSHRVDGDWASFLGETEQEAVNKAAAAVAVWNRQTVYDESLPQTSRLRHHRGAPYRIFVAKTTGEAKLNVPYTLDESPVEV
jgi:hypothetical protein